MSTSDRAKMSVNRRLGSEGFSLIELMIAMAILMVVMAVAMTGVVESQRGINTVVARETDATQAQSLVDAFTAQVRSASSAAVYDCSGLQCNQVWLYNSSPPTSWPYSCTVWAYNTSAAPPELEAYVSSATVNLSAPTIASISAAMVPRLQLLGATPVSGGMFQIFTNYPGLVDVHLQVQYQSSALQSSVQGASSPSQLEAEGDSVNVWHYSTYTPGTAGLPNLVPSVPASSCY